MPESQQEDIAQNVSIRPLLILDSSTLARNSIFLEHFFVALADQSVHAAIVCPPDCNTSAILSPTIDIIIHPACQIPLLWRQNRKMLFEKVGEFKPTVIHCINRQQIGITRQIAQTFAIPYVLGARGMDKFHFAEISDPLCSGILTPSQTIRQFIAAQYPDCASKIVQIEAGAFVEDSTACFANPQLVPSMMVIRPLDNASDFEVLFGAVKLLAEQNYEVLVVLIGKGKADSAVRKMIRTMGLSQVINVVPNFPMLRAAMAEADICIRPRPVYAFSVPLLEAMSVGMVVAGCKGGVDDLLIENETAILFDPDDKYSIADALKKILQNKDEARRIAANAQAYLRQHNTVSKMMSGLIDIYKRAGQSSKS